MAPTWGRYSTPAERQNESGQRAYTARYGDDPRRGDEFGSGACRYECRPLADDHPHAGDAERMRAPLVRYPNHEGGIGRELVGTECGRG